MRQRIYNPAQLTPGELKASFVARHETLARMLRLLTEQKPGHPCQHLVLVGPRGMGKTTLGLSFLQAVREQEDLTTKWQPVPFPEESYEIGDLADFWLAALRHLAHATGEDHWRDQADGLQADERDAERLAAYALAALLDFSEERRKRLILFVENLDLVLSQLRDEREVHALRETLMTQAEILLVGSANSVFDAIRSYGEPFYEFFRIVPLPGLDPDECRELLQALANQEDEDRRPVALDLDDGRLETIRRLTGGNPRLLVLTCRMLRESPLGTAMEDLERLIDEQTPYFKARIEALPAQARKVFHCLAKAWAPLRTREVAAEMKLGSSHASAQLRQLMDKGYVREVRQDGEKRSRYEVSDRFYNMYYLLRFSPAGRVRLERLVDFLHQLYGPIGMRRTYEAALDELRKGTVSPSDMADWVTVFAGHVAADQDYPARASWLSAVTELIVEMLGQGSPPQRELGTAVAAKGWDQPNMARVLEAGLAEVLDGDAVRAEVAFRDVMATTPGTEFVQLALGFALYRQGEFADALAAFRQAEPRVVVDNESFAQAFRGLARCGEAFALLRMGQMGAAAAVFAAVPAPNIAADLVWRLPQALALRALGDAFYAQGQSESAMQAWSRVAELARRDDPAEMARVRRAAVVRQGFAQLRLRNVEDAYARLGPIAEEEPDELAQQRHDQAGVLLAAALAGAESGRSEDATALLGRLPDYIRADDPEDLRSTTTLGLAAGSTTFCLVGHPEAAEMAARHAARTDPKCPVAWSALAEALLARKGRARLEEAERCARHAVELAPADEDGLVTLHAVLKRRSKRNAAKDLLGRAPGARTDASGRLIRRWTPHVDCHDRQRRRRASQTATR